MRREEANELQKQYAKQKCTAARKSPEQNPGNNM